MKIALILPTTTLMGHTGASQQGRAGWGREIVQEGGENSCGENCSETALRWQNRSTEEVSGEGNVRMNSFARTSLSRARSRLWSHTYTLRKLVQNNYCAKYWRGRIFIYLHSKWPTIRQVTNVQKRRCLIEGIIESPENVGIQILNLLMVGSSNAFLNQGPVQ